MLVRNAYEVDSGVLVQVSDSAPGTAGSGRNPTRRHRHADAHDPSTRSSTTLGSTQPAHGSSPPLLPGCSSPLERRGSATPLRRTSTSTTARRRPSPPRRSAAIHEARPGMPTSSAGHHPPVQSTALSSSTPVVAGTGAGHRWRSGTRRNRRLLLRPHRPPSADVLNAHRTRRRSALRRCVLDACGCTMVCADA